MLFLPEHGELFCMDQNRVTSMKVDIDDPLYFLSIDPPVEFALARSGSSCKSTNVMPLLITD